MAAAQAAEQKRQAQLEADKWKKIKEEEDMQMKSWAEYHRRHLELNNFWLHLIKYCGKPTPGLTLQQGLAKGKEERARYKKEADALRAFDGGRWVDRNDHLLRDEAPCAGYEDPVVLESTWRYPPAYWLN